jgi:uncharacterized membrane protein
MKNVFGLFKEKENRTLAMSFMVFMLFGFNGVIALFKGIENHQTWRIAAASAGCTICAAFCLLAVYNVVKNSLKIASASPV